MPDFKTLVRERLASFNLELAAEASLTEELSQHLEDLYADLLSEGQTTEQAYSEVAAELQDVSLAHKLLRGQRSMPRHEAAAAGDTRGGRYMEQFFSDAQYALRSIRNNPLFALFVVLTLALGIGANTTVFTVLNTLILNP